jgi:hypothetical protein
LRCTDLERLSFTVVVLAVTLSCEGWGVEDGWDAASADENPAVIVCSPAPSVAGSGNDAVPAKPGISAIFVAPSIRVRVPLAAA